MKTPSWLRSFRKRPSGDKTSRTALRLEVLEDRLTPAGVFPNDPFFPQQWPLHNTGQLGGLFGSF